MRAGDYFNDHNMKERDPDLYEELLGRFHPYAEPSNEKLSERLLRVDDQQRQQTRLEVTNLTLCAGDDSDDEYPSDSGDEEGESEADKECEREDVNVDAGSVDGKGEHVEEVDGEEAGYVEDGMRVIEQERHASGVSRGGDTVRERRQHNGSAVDIASSQTNGNSGGIWSGQLAAGGGPSVQAQISEDEQQQQREAMVRAMQERFLCGRDVTYFDYKKVDNNNQYDDIEQRSRDEEEAWFDASDDD